MRKIVVSVVVAACIPIVWLLIGRGGNRMNEFRFVEIQRGDLESVVSSTGTLQATTTVEVGTQVSGQVAEIFVDFNDRVQRDQLIARIDPTLLEQEVRSAEANVERNRAELEQAQREMDRMQRLYSGKVATESEYNTAQYQLAVAEASYKSAQVNLERAHRNLKYTEIRAPIDGIVLERTVDVGQTVAASLSAPKLFLIAEDLAKMEILASVDESDIGQIVNGQEVRFSVQAYPDEFFTGTVSQVRLQSIMQENVVNYTVVVAVENPDGQLLPGMTATVEFIIQRESDILKVANAALRFRPNQQMWAAFRERQQALRGDRTATERLDSTGHADKVHPGAADRNERGDRSGNEDAGPLAGSHSTLRSTNRTLLWHLDEDGNINAKPVQTGITDGQYTAVQGPGIQAGMQVIVAVTTSSSSSAVNPFQQQQQQGRRRPPPGI